MAIIYKYSFMLIWQFFLNSFIICLFIFKILNTIFFCDSPIIWQTYFSEPASVIMEGIIIFNKHLLFLLVVIVVFVAWLLFFAILYFFEFKNKFSSKFVHSTILEIVWTW